MKTMTRLFASLALALAHSVAFAEPLTVAVAANFTKTIEEVGRAFQRDTGHEVRFSFGPTGKLYAQISNGAPFDAFFAADEARPRLLVEQGLAQPDSYFVYSVGKLALYSPDLPVATEHQRILQEANFRHLSIANPRTAPYGVGAEEVLRSMGLLETLGPKLVNGESIAHAFQYIITGNASLGFVAYSQIVDPDSPAYGKGQSWLPPQELYAPINQAAVVLQRGAEKPAMRAFIDYLRSDSGRAIIERYGYDVP